MFFYAKEDVFMGFTSQKVEQLAFLSSLSLSAEEKERFAQELNPFLKCVEKIRQVNTDNTQPLIHILPNYNVFRPDEVIPSPGQEEMLKNAKVTAEGHYKVPRIM